MIIAVLSGKGGTGKTTVAVNLAVAMGWRYLDCDTEEPNGWLYLRPTLQSTQDVSILFPVVDGARCSRCGACASACQFQALGIVADRVKVFQQLCHGCGLCALLCPLQAIQEEPRSIGRIDRGMAENGTCWQGVLNVGEPSGVRIIDQMLEQVDAGGPVLLDCAPGTSCSVVACVQAADFALLVTEATPFGAHDLELSMQLLQRLGLPGGVVINRYDGEEAIIRQLAHKHSLPIIGNVPFSRQAAAACAAGQLLCQQADFLPVFQQIGQQLMEMMSCS